MGINFVLIWELAFCGSRARPDQFIIKFNSLFNQFGGVNALEQMSMSLRFDLLDHHARSCGYPLYFVMATESDTLRQKIAAGRKKAMDKTLAEVASSVPKMDNFRLTHRRKLSGHCDKVYCCVWSPLPRRLMSASLDGKLIVWDATTGNKAYAIANDCTWVMSCAFGPDSEELIACGGLDNRVSIYRLKVENDQYNAVSRLEGHEGYISSCTFVGKNKLLSSSGDNSIKLWDIDQGTMTRNFLGHEGDVGSLTMHQNGNDFLTASADKTVMMWDVRKKMPVRSFVGHSADVTGVKYFPNWNLFGTVSEDGTAGLFDLRSDQRVGTYKTPEGSLFMNLDFSKSGRVVFFGCNDFNVYCFDVLSESEICVLKGCHSNSVHRVGVSPQGDALFSASWDNTIRIWN